MNAETSSAGSPRLAAALHVANACYEWSHDDGLYEHIFSTDFQIPGHVLQGLGLLEIPGKDEPAPWGFRWLVDDPNQFEDVIRIHLETGPPHEEVLIALAFCFIDLTDARFDLLVAEDVFAAEKDIEPNLWGKLIASPVPTPYGRQLEQQWLSWWDQH